VCIHATTPTLVGVGAQAHPADGVGGGQHRLGHDRHRDLGGSVQPGHHPPRLLGHLAQRLVAVQVLAPGQEPDLLVGVLLHPRRPSLSPLALACRYRSNRRCSTAWMVMATRMIAP
jgi:hypothetical protein